MKRLILIILLAINSLNAQWQQVTNWPKGQRWLNSVYFIDSLYGWIVGNDKWIYHSTDGGQTWLERLNPTYSELNAVQFIDRKLGYTVGSPGGGWYGVFLKTTNGGQDWFNLTNPVQGAARNVVFLDSLNGWACGATTPLYYYGDTTGDNGGLVWKTTNGGNTWTYQKFGKPVFGFFHIQMLPNGNGWLLGLKELYTTTDFGFTWNKYNSLPLPAGFKYYQLALKGDKVYITVSSSTLDQSWIYMTQNGLDWQLLSILGGRPPSPKSLVVIDDNNLYIILLGGVMKYFIEYSNQLMAGELGKLISTRSLIWTICLQ